MFQGVGRVSVQNVSGFRREIVMGWSEQFDIGLGGGGGVRGRSLQ